MISAQGLGLHHAGNYLFRDVNFTIKKDDKIGLVGKNGAGKSTLLKILSKEINFYEGNVVSEGEITIGFLKQDLDFVKGRTVCDETMQAYEQINAMKNELEEVNHQMATRTDYESDAYSDLICRAYDEIAKNSGFQRAILATRNSSLTHSMGKSKKNETVLTEQEFCSNLYRIRDKLQAA